MKGISLFSSAGIAELLFNELDIEIVLANELLEKRAKFYKDYHENKNIIVGDIKDKKVKDEIYKYLDQDIEFLMATPPCQGVSNLGKNKSQEAMIGDDRNFLIFDVMEIIDKFDFKYILIENVPRYLKMYFPYKKKYLLLEDILKKKYGRKYEIDIKVLNSKDYGVPQNRERWYCIGVRSDLGLDIEKFSFPEKKELTNVLSKIIETCEDKEYQVSDRCWENIEKFVKEKEIKISPSTLAYDIRPSRCHFVKGDVSNCLTAKMGTGGNNVPVVISQRRKLTERECLRLMGYPNTYKVKKGFQTYKQIGNSVVVPVISEIAEKLIRFIND